ncbi:MULTISPECIES: GTP-binding protein [Gordonibacter]|uniref:GTP-binding protein n=1 Tax=Gordonibacter faecis TaxID=3047475 RepID=A0ABT7DM87_9ACTN|nr:MULTISPECIES: GTP-binding protein [unclassified Gordonibacter]MDJ1650652.1 GTP-binding protein [Gordonibacter sp. KGMB12511]HIW75820.1 GTPase (G3E family) [Candidatus Gordonibacter avicola]
MDKIRFMVVSGFLGAGKTTTMIALAEHMNKTYGETAIIANDLGANLVDTNLTQTSGCTVAEIASGCICYQMDNTIDQIRRLRDKDGAVFVMSDIPGCGVGALDHVYHRLAEDCADEFTLSPFTVVVDPERLRMIMPERADINLPEELVYLLKLQLEEADLVVLNKADLLEPTDIERYVDFLKTACPDIPVIVISALKRTGIDELAAFITTHETQLKNFSVRNNKEFEDAEAKLTWYNRRLYLKTNDGNKIDCNAVVEDLIEGIRMGFIERKRNVPHLKTFATSGNGDFNKASLIGVDYDVEYAQQLLRPHKNLRMIINARAVCEARPLARLMDDALDEVCEKYGLDCQVFFTECFGMADEGR